jgi:hypothetical protein
MAMTDKTPRTGATMRSFLIFIAILACASSSGFSILATGVLRFTFAFDAHHHASVKNVRKTKTELSE